jgi:hypothetical protein
MKLKLYVQIRGIIEQKSEQIIYRYTCQAVADDFAANDRNKWVKKINKDKVIRREYQGGILLEIRDVIPEVKEQFLIKLQEKLNGKYKNNLPNKDNVFHIASVLRDGLHVNFNCRKRTSKLSVYSFINTSPKNSPKDRIGKIIEEESPKRRFSC